MTSILTSVPLRNLFLDEESNVRRQKATKEQEAALRASIERVGILVPLTGKKAPKQNGSDEDRFAVSMGSRRLAALQAIHGPKSDHKVPILLLGEQPISGMEASLIDSVFHVPHHPVDQFEAFSILKDKEGKSVEDIATQYAIKPEQVRQRLALGSLAPEIREAWKAGTISATVAQAFTLGADHKAQSDAFKRLKKSGKLYEQAIRSEFIGDDRDVPRLLNVIDKAAYEKRGGRIIQDLFHEQHGVSDSKLLRVMVRELVGAKIAELEKEGWGWVAFNEDLPHTQSVWRRVTAGKKDLSAEAKAKLGCVIFIDSAGKLGVEQGVERPSDAKAPSKSKEKTATSGGEPAGLPNSLAKRLSEQATNALAAALLADQQVALSAVIAAVYCNRAPLKLRIDRPEIARANIADNQSFSLLVGRIHKQGTKKKMEALAKLARDAADITVFNAESDIFDKDAGALAALLKPAALFSALLGAFDAEDYFKSAPAAMAKAALKEMGVPEPKDAKTKAKVAVYAAEAARKKKWLPKELRGPWYPGSAGSKKR